ncbi:MAG: hypothetical protein KY447_08025 [Actinobacteria bacterium]|nr:hypothetical protein [Actinomycetota bacterium]
MTVTDPFTHLEQAWGLEGNPFPSEAMSNNDADPYAEVFTDETDAFYRKLLRGGVVNNLHMGFLWSQGTRNDTGFGKTRLMRHARAAVNADQGNQVLAASGLAEARRPRIAAAYSNLNNLNATSLYQVAFNAVVDLANPVAGHPAVLECARAAVVSDLAGKSGVAPDDVAAQAVSDTLRLVRLQLFPGAAPLRADVVDAFGRGGTAVAAALGQVSPATRMRSGLEYLDFAITALAAAGIDHLFLFVDQLEDLATNKSITAAKRSREIGRIRDLLEEEPYASRLHMVFTFHNSAARVLERFWEIHRLPRFEIAPDNQAAVVVLRGLTTDEQAAEVLKAYLERKRLTKAGDDDLLPFDHAAVTVLRAVSEGRVGTLLSMAHGLVQEAASAGVPIITGDFAMAHFTGAGLGPDGDDGDEAATTTGSDLDDLLLA